ncbi:probable helicase with zinc finger domain isoform X2 [Parasteatoda tepidariorum]|nr:probable helicase with zinc finger domain isoform X2 [Parasteatoda tepidariorum]
MIEFCDYCSVIFNTEAELIAHCNSEAHQLTIMSDEGREWKFRAPPRGVGADQYSVCVEFGLRGMCRLNKLCCDAHGDDELSEWKERFDYRQKKLLQAKERRLQGRHYTEQLLDKWLTAPNPNSIMSEVSDAVEIAFEPELNLTVSEKNCCREWTFHISAKATLRHAALLYETHRFHFRISQLRARRGSDMKEYNLGPQCQEWNNEDLNAYTDESYTMKVRFLTNIYGTFRQDIVFDFGFEPVLVKKLCVDVVSLCDMEKLQQARETVVSFTERWSNNDVTIVPFENRPHPLGDLEKNLLSCYPVPNGKFNVTNSVMEPTLTPDNYCARQHELLCIEEMTQYELLSRYNIQATLNLSSCYLLTPNSAVTAKYAHNGELFAHMTLTSVLSEDSASGRLILSNCSTVLLASVKTKGEEQRKVYEAVIEDKGKTVIYMRLSKKCCEELKLGPDREFLAEVQFQLNRLPVCEMHFAVDRLHPTSIVFPDISEVPQLWKNKPLNQKLKSFEPKLNPKQREAVLAITTPLCAKLPPVLIIGPFGTGKTYTLAQAVKIILDDPNSRILVCTHSNSAADIYIREYLHPQVAEGRIEATPLRIYYRHRWVATVHPTVQQYCLINCDNNEKHFVMPTADDVKAHRIIVTTLKTARYLVQLGLEKGFFTHILIDEAAQAMECEAIMPLSLADEDTRIVLAGDHMQLCPEVYSPFAQERNLHMSLLERLYDLYPEQFPCKVLLCENYRSHEAIVQYTSELFYNNHLQASGQQPRHEKFYPLTFFTARGEDVQDCNSTAFHNNAEVYELIERVSELKNNWPAEWGIQDESSIGVVTPYYDQVVRIRAELRKKKMHGVSVERVLNVQGKQFRVIFLSVVRTRQTCGSKAKPESDLDHGFLSNARLLNTAITRAQSLVCVVGDPVSLCSVGKCRKLWEKFILTCHKETSLFGITWDSLRSQLDSMELKKNFILNPLAPEFIPGRVYHGFPVTTAATSENFYTNNPPPQPFFVFSALPSPFQGPPLIQPAVAMVSAPHPYGMLNNVPNCVVPPMIPPAQLNPFQNYPFNSPSLPSPLPQQRPANIPNRIQTAPFPRKIINQRNPPLLEHPMKDFDHGFGLGRPIKRSEPQVPFQVANKPITRGPEDNNQENFEEMKRHLLNNVDRHVNGFQMKSTELENSVTLQNYPNNYFEKGNKFSKSEEIPNVPLRNGFCGDELNMGLFADPSRKIQMNGVWAPPKMRSESDLHNNSVNSFEEHHMRMPFNDMNGMASEKERFMFEPPNAHMYVPPPPPDKWPNATEPLQSTNSADLPAFNIPMVQTSLLEKLGLLQKFLPPGTNIPAFLDNDEQIKAYIQNLVVSEGSQAAKAFVVLLLYIKRDQEALQEVYQRKMRNARFQSPSHNIPETPTPVARNIPCYSSPRPVFNNISRPQESFNNSESLNSEVPFNPFSMPHIFSLDKLDATFNNSDRNKQEVQKPHSNMGNFVYPWVSENMNGSCQNDPPVYEMSKLSVRSPVQNKIPNGDLQEDAFSSSAYHNRHFGGEATEENLRHIFGTPDAPPINSFNETNNDSRGALMCSFPDGGNQQNSYLNRLRNLPPTYNSNNYELDFARIDDGLVSKSSEYSGVMTAGPLSVSYPDIPDLLSHICPNSKDTSKVIRKPTPRTSESSSSPFVYGINLQPNNDSSLRYPQISSEGMTYAKILSSPQQ